MQKLIRIATGLYLLFGIGHAYAVPSFARQTGLFCNVCQRNTKDLLLSKYIPLSVLILISNTAFQANQPATQNNAAGFPQQLSIFLAGGVASHFGGLAQVTYTHSDDHFGMDNTDLRYAN